MPFIGPWEIALILAIVIIIFGPKKLPQLAKSVGDAIRQYRQASEGGGNASPTTAPAQGRVQSPADPSAQARAGEVLIDTARQMGIETDGKTLDQISKEITNKTAPKSS